MFTVNYVNIDNEEEGKRRKLPRVVVVWPWRMTCSGG